MNAALPAPPLAPAGREWAWPGAGLLISLLVVWLITRQGALVAGFGGGLIALGGLAYGLRPRGGLPATEFTQPDWSVTVAAIDRPDCAVAVTDRAGRLVCANGLYERMFGAAHAPPHLPVDAGSLERLGSAMRMAWRDGKGHADLLERGPERWRAGVERAGRAEDFLVWRLSPLVAADPLADLARGLTGRPGQLLGAAGLAAAVVDPEGLIRAASPGFAERGLGDAQAATAGREFVSLLAQDDDGRLFWARDTRRAAPVTLFFVPLEDHRALSPADPQAVHSLMLLADAGVGVGGDVAPSMAAPQIEGLLADLPLGLAMADRDGRLLFGNAAFLRAAGRDGNGGGGGLPTWPTDLVVREDKAALSDAVRRFAQGVASAGDVAVRLVHQPDEPVSLSLAGVRGLGEAAVLLSLSDSTEEARLKRQVAQATKMQAVGQLAGGVAHDFNNVLTAILGTCDLMLLRHTPGDSDYDDIQQIRASSNRAASLTRQLLAFSRQQTLRPEVLQLPDVVSDVSQMLRRLIGEKIQLVVTHDRDLGPVRADPTQMEQVIVNLVVNARDAMQEQMRAGSGAGGDGSGRLLLATRRVPAGAVRAMRSEILPVADYTALVVEDSGGGIPAENLAKIWEPFFTTKEVGRGTGLGLSTVYGIVKQSGGFIFAESEPGRGARFTLYLPVHHVAAEVVAKPRDEAVGWAGGGDLLLVEDEDSVRVVAERALARAGYTVTTARDGEEGLELLRARAQAGGPMYDMVVSDVVMPGMDGPAMVRAMREVAPALPVLFMSGHAEEQLRREIDIENARFLGKPFSVQQIGDSVAAVLRGRG